MNATKRLLELAETLNEDVTGLFATIDTANSQLVQLLNNPSASGSDSVSRQALANILVDLSLNLTPFRRTLAGAR